MKCSLRKFHGQQSIPQGNLAESAAVKLESNLLTSNDEVFYSQERMINTPKSTITMKTDLENDQNQEQTQLVSMGNQASVKYANPETVLTNVIQLKKR